MVIPCLWKNKPLEHTSIKCKKNTKNVARFVFFTIFAAINRISNSIL